MEKQFVEIKNNIGMRVVFSTLGASIFAIYINDKIMTLTPVEVSDFLKKNCYYGKNIGPIANRIKEGKMELNGHKIQFAINEGNNTLHSSSSSISDLEFEIDKNNLTNRYHLIRFSLKSKNLPGLRGSIIYRITYKLHLNRNVLELMYDAKPTSDSVISLTNHAYFCLGSDNIENARLMIPTNEYVEPNKEDLIYLGKKEIIPCLDFNKKKKIAKDINNPYLVNSRTNGYDHCFLLNGDRIVLENIEYRLDIISDFKAVQIYSDNYDDHIKVVNSLRPTHRAIAIEPMDDPFNKEVVLKNSHYKRKIVYKFKAK